MGNSSIDKTDENEGNDKIDNQKAEVSLVSEVVPGSEEGIEIEDAEKTHHCKSRFVYDTGRNSWGRNKC